MCVPMVSTGRPSAAVATAPPATAINMPGQPGRRCFSPVIVTMVAPASAMVAASAVGRCAHITGSFSRSGPGSGTLSVRPSNSLT